tara:strand:+ start:1375 stop:1872 length:498 start_codon:yes stop_codon:yes gene_type:complete
MSEKRLVIDQLRLNYDGLFNTHDFFTTIMAFYYERGYDMLENRNHEFTTPKGKVLEIELKPWKKTTDYAKSEFRIRIFIKDLKDVEVNKDGAKVKIQQGNLQLILDAYLVTDYEDRLENKPYFYFLRALVDKYIFSNYTDKFESMLINDTQFLHSKLKAFLNMYK